MQLLRPHGLKKFSKTTSLCLVCDYKTENDVDGETLLKLTENMVSKLNSAPTLPSLGLTLSSSNPTVPHSTNDSATSQECGCVSKFSGYFLATLLKDYVISAKTFIFIGFASIFLYRINPSAGYNNVLNPIS